MPWTARITGFDRPLLRLNDFVFASIEGEPIDPSVLSHSFGRIAKKVGLENSRFNGLWPTFTSLLLLHGAKPKVISETLRHSCVVFTMDVYSHIIVGMQSDAMALLNQVLPQGMNGVEKPQ
jgi:integrase